jgi:hypothetical protein
MWHVWRERRDVYTVWVLTRGEKRKLDVYTVWVLTRGEKRKLEDMRRWGDNIIILKYT